MRDIINLPILKNIKSIFLLPIFVCFFGVAHASAVKIDRLRDTSLKPLDTARYDSLMRKLANGHKRWPVKTKAYPLPGAILPFNRIVAYYGNMYSKNMGVLGQYPPKIMLAKLKAEVKNWEKADTATPVIPALHYICVTAQADAGRAETVHLDAESDARDGQSGERSGANSSDRRTQVRAGLRTLSVLTVNRRYRDPANSTFVILRTTSS